MKFDLDYPQWQEPLLRAVIDGQGFVEIESIIRERLRCLISEREQDALFDALATIRLLKKEGS